MDDNCDPPMKVRRRRMAPNRRFTLPAHGVFQPTPRDGGRGSRFLAAGPGSAGDLGFGIAAR